MVYTSVSLASVAISLLALSDAKAISTTASSSYSIASSADSSAQPTSTHPTCPEANNNIFIAKSGATFVVECGIDYAGGDLKSVNIASNRIGDCINACDATEGCIDISMSGTACYMKKKLNKPLVNKGIRGARKIKDAPLSLSSSASSTTTTLGFSVTQPATFSEPTASTAPATASVPTVNQGTEYINYTNVAGYFLQDLASTVPSTFDYTATNFGLINQTYSTDTTSDAGLTQWQRFNNLLNHLNSQSPKNTAYKLLFIGRHGEGYHNAAQTYYGTPAWNCYWSQQTGNSTNSWQDADLTPNGVAQALKANSFWSQEISQQKIQPPQVFYVSPLTRCLKTANYTFSGLGLENFVPTIKELIREGISTHTCDHRSNKTYIHDLFPTWSIESSFTETDELWNGITEESSSAQDYRSKIALDEIFSSSPKDAEVISITTHSGEASSLLRVLGHRSFSLVTGAVIPVFVKAEVLSIAKNATTTTTVPWDAAAWCTNGPPVTSDAACVCSNGVLPVATTASSV
ncbi:putative GPI anchored protein, partial [Aureobasidium melanogenum]